MSAETTDLLKFAFEFEALQACPLCQEIAMIPSGKVAWLNNEFWYVVCPSCGLKYMNPRPTKESYQKYYRDYFWQQKIRNITFKQTGQIWQGNRSKFDDDRSWQPAAGRKRLKQKIAARRSGEIIATLDKHHRLGKKSRVLEVGCGYPVTLQTIGRQHQSQLFAIEPSVDARSEISQLDDISLVGRFAEDLVKLEDQFDVVIFSHVLENTTDPLLVFRAARERLMPKGIMYVQTPNLLTFDQMNPYHPFIFSMSALQFLTDKLSLEYHQESAAIDSMLVMVAKEKN